MSFTDKHLRAWELSALLTLCFFLLSGLWAEGKQASISSSLVRLHVLAVSDEAEEQAVKLQVRDAVLQYLAPRLRDAEDAESAGMILESALEEIRAAAESAAAGRPVRVTLGEERYPTREYAGFALPAGRYRSLRVVLGEGQGHNWWCVVFPPVCLNAVQREAMQPVMNPEDYALITREEGWEIRFRIVELWGKLISFCAG
jgi:stage II sporulation protein R